jgi:hypothetical protein
MAGVTGVRQLGPCARVRLPPPRPTKNRPLPWSAEEDARGNALGQLLFITVEPHSLGGGGGQHRGRWTGTWLRGLPLQNLP